MTTEFKETLRMANEWSDENRQIEEAARVRAEMRYQELLSRFQEYVTTHEPSRESLTEAWKLYAKLAVIDTRIRFPGAGITRMYEWNEMAITKILAGESYFGTDMSLVHFAFKLSTTKPLGHKVGKYLEGLNDDDLKKATLFCTAMDEVGWRPGDLQERYPE